MNKVKDVDSKLKNNSNIPITMHWENINVFTPEQGNGLLCFKKNKPTAKHIIKNGIFRFTFRIKLSNFI